MHFCAGNTGRLFLILIIAVLILTPGISAGPAGESGLSCDISYNETFLQENTTSDNAVYVFYNRYCSACHRALPVIEDFSNKYPEIEVYYFDTYNSSENLTLLREFGDKYNIPFPAYPILFTGKTVVLEGVSSISENSGDVFKSIKEGLIPNAEYEKKWTDKGSESQNNTQTGNNSSKTINYFAVALAGLADGINPCAFAVLVFLLISLMSAGSKRGILLTGAIYTCAVFIFYTLAGFGIMGFVEFAGFSVIFSIFAGLVAITAGIISLCEAADMSLPFSLSISKTGRRIISGVSERITLTSAFLLGILVGLFELPCTGGIYLAIISLLSSEMTFYGGFPYLILYNAVFILPLLVITCAVYLGVSPEKIDEFRSSKKKALKLIMGIILTALGLFVILWKI
ncbi:cytochrome c biogenesis protein CcdA [Methanomicrobium sp. W14]|uniref:hypothetical protein n=1 Tax=Methanomicrobium sp. W14 TaxID=2817839 RepID=UPI001AE32356|nr:hypothetical protein [Methanomicrobium sp. W14]MBP2132946.1 cytochrome c biogenesis protein CcdA [Methanomicrobium sp. W14]